jgi:ABC-type polysaccharide/polyol phosphate export permease
MIEIKPFGIDLFCQGKKFLIFNMVNRNLKIKYRRSVFGFLWTLLVPMGTAFVFYIVFKKILNVQIPNYLGFILSGILPWTFFSQTILEGMESLVGSAGILTKVPVPLQVFPMVGAVTNFVTYALSWPVLIGVLILNLTPISGSIFLLLYYSGLLFFIAYGISMLLGIFYVYFRDLKHAFVIIMQLWFYATPVIYREDMVPEKYRILLALNPVGYIFTGIHKSVVNASFPSIEELVIPAVWSLALMALAVLALKKLSPRAVESL